MDTRPRFRAATRYLALLALAALLVPSLAVAKDNRFMVRSSHIEDLARDYDLRVVRHLGGPQAHAWLVESDTLDKQTFLQISAADSRFDSAEAVVLASLPSIDLASIDPLSEAQPDLARSGTFQSPCIDRHLGPTWSGFAEQRALATIRVHEAQSLAGDYCGEGSIVAVIDTGVDPDHPLLAGALLPGYDFVGDQGGSASEWTDLDIRLRAIVEGGDASSFDSAADPVLAGEGHLLALGASAAILSEEDAALLDAEAEEIPPFFGHGTMTAGLVRIVAPGASILPLKAFASDGTATTADIVSAIYYAVEQGAHVINMSFSMVEPSAELETAIEHARSLGVMTVAATGNQGHLASIYPASYPAVIGVAATDHQDQLTAFSNFGIYTADMTAPGAALITLYPGNRFAATWGTSYSAPLAAGTLALIRPFNKGGNKGSHKQTRWDLLLGSQYFSYLYDDILCSGRLDTVGALIEARF